MPELVSEPMILLEVAFATTADRRADFLAAMEDVVAGSQAEPGCVTYHATASLDDPLTFHLIEIWASEAAYLAHRVGEPLRQFKARLDACGKVTGMVRRIGPLDPYEPPVN